MQLQEVGFGELDGEMGEPEESPDWGTRGGHCLDPVDNDKSKNPISS